MSKYVNLCETTKAFCVKELCILCESNFDICDSERDLGNKSKVNATCNLKACDNSIEKQSNSRLLPDSKNANSSTFTMQTKDINSPEYNFSFRSTGRTRYIIRASVQFKRRNREPSGIPMKKLLYFMSKGKKRWLWNFPM